VKPFLADDSRKIYQEFLDHPEKNSGKPYAIISKQGCEIYIFDNEHRLLSKNNVLLGPGGVNGDKQPDNIN